MLPMENNGSIIIYHRIIKPFVKKHESSIDEAFKTGQQLAGEAMSKGNVTQTTPFVHSHLPWYYFSW